MSTTAPIPLSSDTDGVLRVGDSRVTLDTVVAAFREGMTPEGIVEQYPSLELAGLRSADDPTILEWAAQSGRVLLTHDVAAMTYYAYQRVRDGKPMPGVFEMGRHVPISIAIEEIILLLECSIDGEWEGQVRYLPLR